MLREVSLRKALQDARDRRGRELEEVERRSHALRRRLRELTDRSLALGTVHARFFVVSPAIAPTALPVPAVAETPPPAVEAPRPPLAAPAPWAQLSPSHPPLAPMKRPEESHENLLLALSARHAEGFTVGQMREIMDEVEGGMHTYDVAWTLAGTLQRARIFDVAGSRQGPAGPIRVFRVARRPEPVGVPSEVP